MKWAIALFAVVLLLSTGHAIAQQPDADNALTLNQLLEQVRSGRESERRLNALREAEFLEKKERQQEILAAAKFALAAEKNRSKSLELTFEQNERHIGDLEKRLAARVGNLGDLSGIARLLAGEVAADIENSLISAQFPGRAQSLRQLADSRTLPTIKQLRGLWYSLQQEMTESGNVARFEAPILQKDGRQVVQNVVRIGAFNAISGGRYLTYLPGVGRLAELGRQPRSEYVDLLPDFESAKDGIMPIAIDPSRGALLSLLIQKPSLWERISQGGVIAYVIIAIAVLGFGISTERGTYLFLVDRRVKAQLSSDKALLNNPLGHVIAAFEANREAELDTIELKLDEAVLRGIPKLERGLPTIRVLAAVAPLLGLLGTVAGMIETFQSITLFGTGDPKIMAGGISQALVTTVLGLMTAIPLVLAHSAVRARSNRLIQVLEEQSAGIIATRAERGRGKDV